jgi:hypothetical protein
VVRFEFTLDDSDAEVLISILNDERVRALDRAVNSTAEGRKDGAKWYQAQADYLEGLKQKVLAGNTRVG